MPQPPHPPLTARQEAFARHALTAPTLTDAALQAGYEASSAAAMGSYLAKDPRILAYQAPLRARLDTQAVDRKSRILQELERVAYADARGLYHPDGGLKSPTEWDDDTAATVAGLEVRRVRTSVLSSGQPSGTGGGGTPFQQQEDVVKVKRWDKVRALEVLARDVGIGVHSSRPAGGGGVGGGGVPGTGYPVPRARVEGLSDADLDAAYRLSTQLLGEGEG